MTTMEGYMLTVEPGEIIKIDRVTIKTTDDNGKIRIEIDAPPDVEVIRDIDFRSPDRQ